jgi:tuftelin-interacting protein 11
VDDEYDDANPGAVPASAEQEDEDEDEEMGGVGLGFKPTPGGTAPSGGLGWMPPTQQELPVKSRPAAPSFVRSTTGPVNPLGTGFTPTSAQGPTLLVRDDAPPQPRSALPSAFKQTRDGKTKINKQSFGARMMAKMGYVEGQGLGKDGTGRSVIIEANLRPQGVGLGAVKEKTKQEREEEKRQARLRGEVVIDSDEEEKKKKAARKKKALAGGLGSGPGSGASTPRPQKPKYMTLEEIKKAAPGLNIPDAFTPILDMTGREKKMLTSSSGLMTPTSGAAAAETGVAAENRKLVRRAQNDFMAILEEWQSLQERKAYLELQLKQEQQELEELSASLQLNQSIMAACEAASKPTNPVEDDMQTALSLKLHHIISGLNNASSLVSDDVQPQIKEELASLVVAAIHPLFNQYRQLWQPLEEPKPAFLDDLLSIRGLLGLDQQPKKSFRKPAATPYEAMMYELWLRTVTPVVREWDAHDPDPLVALVDAWDTLLPGFVRAQLVKDIIRKLEEALQRWQPKKHKHSFPHLWIFPWLPYLPASHLDPKSSTGLVADVRRKFRQLIDGWDYQNGIIPGLKQWKDVLRPPSSHDSSSCDTWLPLVMNHILPGMARHLRASFRVDPQDQEPYMEALECLFDWLGIIRPSMLGEVVVAEVFPLWHQVLYSWLLMDSVNYNEIAEWLRWWHDDVFPEELNFLPSIVAEFEKGHAMIERALDLGDRARTELRPPEKGPALKSHRERAHKDGDRERRSRREREEKPVPGRTEEITFRHIVDEWCQQHELQFMPERSEVHDKGPLYRISRPGSKKGLLVYFKGNSLVALVKGQEPRVIRRENEHELWVLEELVS